jgi:hypothetical protein
VKLSNIISYHQRQRLLSSIKRMWRWEFWPMSLFYAPVVIYILGLVIRYRGLTFTAVNPGLPGSGFIGENKSDSLLQLQKNNTELTAKTILISQAATPEKKYQQCNAFMQKNKLTYPVVLKPDFGQRGIDVAIISNEKALVDYLASAVFDTVLQEYINGVEFGVFYMRQPDEKDGQVFSITHKCFPSITGDGVSRLDELISQHPRLHYMTAFLFREHHDDLHTVPAEGEEVDVVRLGSHCRGSLFLEGQQYSTPALHQVVDHLSKQISGFYFGRYDIRAESIDAFQRGEIKVIEVNGVTSESTNMYDPSYSVFTAYRILCKQWKLAFEIGQKNITQGSLPMTVKELVSKVRVMNSGT